MNRLVMPLLSLYALYLSRRGRISRFFSAVDLKHGGVHVNLHTLWILTPVKTDEQKIPLRMKGIDEAP